MGPDSMAMAQQEDRLKVSTTYVVRISHRVLLPPLVSANVCIDIWLPVSLWKTTVSSDANLLILC